MRDLVLRLHQMVLIDGRGRVVHAAARAVDLEVRLDGNDDEVVLRLAEDAALGLGDADHLKRPALDLDGLADRIDVREEAVFMSLPMKATAQVALVLDFGEEAARFRPR